MSRSSVQIRPAARFFVGFSWFAWVFVCFGIAPDGNNGNKNGMGKQCSFTPIKTTAGWMVSVPAAMSATGRRKRKFFADFKKAERFAGSMRRMYAEGMRGGLISGELALQAAAAWQVLEPLGISLVEAARMVAANKGADHGKETFQAKWLRVVSMGETMWSDRYAADIGKIPKWLGTAAMKTPCRELSAKKITEALRANGARAASTVQARRMRVLAVLNWNEERGESTRPGEIQILSPHQTAAVLRACESRDQVRTVALLLFAGIRPDAEDGEITRLDWAAVGEADIYVSKKVSKVGDRHVPITPRLRRLIRGHPAEGPVRPAGWRRAWQRIRKAAGIAEMQDVTRHTFASNYLAAFGDDAAKQAMGHTAGSTVIFRHYRRAVTEAAGKKYFFV
jgi:integrase